MLRMRLRKIPFSLRVVLLYMFFGGLWILLSDQLLEALIPDIALLTRLQTYKGWVFVTTSALLIYVLSSVYSNNNQYPHVNMSRIKKR